MGRGRGALKSVACNPNNKRKDKAENNGRQNNESEIVDSSEYNLSSGHREPRGIGDSR